MAKTAKAKNVVSTSCLGTNDVFYLASEIDELSKKNQWLKINMDRIRSICTVLDCCPDDSEEVKGITVADFRQMVKVISDISWEHDLSPFY